MNIKRHLLLKAIAGFFILTLCSTLNAEWESVSSGIKEPRVNIVLVDPGDKTAAYAASDYYLYMSIDTGASWNQIFSVSGKENVINFINVYRTEQLFIFVATGEGFYVSGDRGQNWQKTYFKTVNCITSDSSKPGSVYIGTNEGIFVSTDCAKTWQLISAGLGTTAIKYITLGESGKIYACSDERIFKSEDSGATWSQIYSMLKKDAIETVSEEELPDEVEELFAKINSLAVNPLKPNEIYAATSKGVLYSNNEGRDWVSMVLLGLDSSQVRHLILAKGRLYIAKKAGVFEYDSEKARWSEAYGGISFRDARFLSADAAGTAIWVATAKGIFKSSPSEMLFSDEKMKLPEYITKKFNDEPSINEVQRSAIRYAEVHPDKIKNWRKEARVKALLPEFDLAYDKTISYDSTGDRYFVGPKDWGVGFKWNVGDVIFSDDQTNIDVRSRLNTQLRDDILDDITRLYYERRRLQVEMLITPPKSEKEKYDKFLRLEELTASIDALTGGYFSARIEKP